MDWADCRSVALGRMAIKLGGRRLALAALGFGLAGWVVPAGAARPADKPLLIPVEPLGFQVIPTRFQSTGATMFTLHFVDEKHLLFTFNKRSLMPRLPDADPLDDDRNIEAVLLELPEGKVLARAQFRTRDRDRYLWPLEHGRFLLRQRSKLTVLDPLRNFERDGAEGAFRQEKFLELTRPIGFLNVSPGGDLLGIETIPPRKPKATGIKADAAALAATVPGAKPPPKPADEGSGRAPVQIHFFRISNERPDNGGRLEVRTAGIVGAPNLISLPTTGEGYLDLKKESASVWDFDFVSHRGTRTELVGFETSCAPRPIWLSRSEFVAFGCRGNEQKQEMSYFTLKGEQPWLSVFSGMHVSPSIVSAPLAGRFALSRTLVASTIFDPENLTSDDLSAQEVSVLSNYDGRVLLKVLATPIQRSAQNFDLSPNGLQFAVLRAGNLEVYRLPALNGREEKALKIAEGLVPEKDDSVVRLGAVPVSTLRAEEKTATQGPGSSEAAAPVAAAPATATPAAAPPAEAPAAASKRAAAAPASDTPAPAAAPAPLSASDAVQSESHRAPAQAEGAPETLGDQPMTGRRRPPSLYTPDHPRGQGDAPASAPMEQDPPK